MIQIYRGLTNAEDQGMSGEDKTTEVTVKEQQKKKKSDKRRDINGMATSTMKDFSCKTLKNTDQCFLKLFLIIDSVYLICSTLVKVVIIIWVGNA